MSAEVFVKGMRGVMANIEKRKAQIERDKERAARSAANVFRRYVRAEAKQIRGKGVAITGISKRRSKRGQLGPVFTHQTRHYLETKVQLVRKLDGWAVRDTAPHAHLVIRGHRMVGHAPNHTFSGQHTGTNPFVHRAFLNAGREPLIAARVVLLEGGPEVPDA